MKNILVIGGTSDIAQALSRLYAVESANIHLLARNEPSLNSSQADLLARGASSVTTASFDALDATSYEPAVKSAVESLGTIDIAFIAFGTLPDQKQCETSRTQMDEAVKINGVAVAHLCEMLLPELVRVKGSLAVISSVAGDRGRQSNYIYGAAKAFVSTYLSGLRNRAFKEGVSVLTIKPGFVDTKMTEQMDKGPLWATPEKVAQDIKTAIDKRKSVLYTPSFWRLIMLIIRSIPEPIFKRLSL